MGWTNVQDELPKEKGEYIVAYHPCYWDHVRDEWKVGLDSFRGKTTWAKAKYQKVTHWMPKPDLPKEDNSIQYGEWIFSGDEDQYMNCSACGHQFYSEDKDSESNISAYCPDCGTPMKARHI
jgi:predicted RNA-binding Zn-ribbon protein involved in translation (DUF1610 family)